MSEERAMKSRWMVLAGSSLAVTKKEHYTARDATLEVVGRLRRVGHFSGHWGGYGAERLGEVTRAWRLTAEREAAYKRLVHESSVEYRRAARESVKAQEAGQDQLWQKEAA